MRRGRNLRRGGIPRASAATPVRASSGPTAGDAIAAGGMTVEAAIGDAGGLTGEAVAIEVDIITATGITAGTSMADTRRSGARN